MRTCLLFLVLTIGSFALEPEDLHGMWRSVHQEDPNSLTEIYYRTDGTMELRWKGTYGALVQWQSFGTWSVKGDTNFVRNTSGWFKHGDSAPAPIEKAPTPLSYNQITSLDPGNPRKLTYRYCDDPGCVNQIFYVGAIPDFTLPTVGGGVSIRSAKAQREPAPGRSGRFAWLVLRDGWVFDLMGRPAR